MSYISLLAQAGKAAAPYLKPLGIRLGKSICTGVLTQLAGKYAFRITGTIFWRSAIAIFAKR